MNALSYRVSTESWQQTPVLLWHIVLVSGASVVFRGTIGNLFLSFLHTIDVKTWIFEQNRFSTVIEGEVTNIKSSAWNQKLH